MIGTAELPKDWKWMKLGELCQTTSGGTPSRREPKYYNGNIPWVKSGELDKGLITDTEEKISAEAVKNSSAKIFPKGTLLIALYGATIGKLAFLGVDAATNQAICGIYQNERISSKFLYNYLFYKKQKLINQGIGGAQPNISQTILKNLELPIPPKAIQQQVVSKIEQLFSEIDKGIEELRTAQQQLKVYRQAVLKWAFEGKLTNKNVKGGELPKDWKILQVKDVCKAILGGGTPSTKNKEYWKGNIPWISSADIYGIKKLKPRRSITLQAVNDSATNILPKGGIVVVTRVGLGKLAVAPFDLCFSQDSQGLILDKGLVSTEYALLVLHKEVQVFKQQSRGTTINGVTKKQLAELIIALPPLQEQQQIVQEIESRLSVCNKIEETITNSLKQAEALRQSILKKAFEGKLDITILNIK